MKIEELLDGMITGNMPGEKEMARIYSEIMEEEPPVDFASYQKSVDQIFQEAFWGLNHLHEFLPYAG